VATSAISNLLAALKTDASALPPAVLFVPTAYLFVQAEPLPDGMQASELEGFAGVTLEGLSPLPIDQLAWGYLAHEKSRHLLLFGAFQDRLRGESISPDDSYFHVLPSFFAAAPADGAAHWVFLWEAGHVAAIHYLAGEVIPSRIEIERLKDNTVAEAFAARENLLKRLSTHARAEAANGLLASPEATRASRDRLNFSFLQYTTPEAEPAKVEGHPPGSSADRWTADLRGGFFRAAEQKRRQATKQATRILQLAGAAALLLFIGQMVVFSGRIWISQKNSVITKQKPDVDLVDQRAALLSKISDFTDHQLHPFEMLGEINEYRPKEITYGKTRAYENNKLSISDVTATDVNAVHTFLEALQNSGLVAVDSNKLNISVVGVNRAKFQLNLTFNKVPEAEPLPAPKPPPAPPPTLDDLTAADANAVDNSQNGPNGFQGGPNGFGGGGGQFQGQGGPNGFQGGPNGVVDNTQPVDNTPAAPTGPTVYLNSQPPAPAPAADTTAAPAPAPAPVDQAQPAQ